MKNIRLAYLLWKLCRRIERDSDGKTIGASLTLVVEGGRGYDARAEDAVARGESPPVRRRGYEVNYWKDVQEPAQVRRGHDFAQALAQVLRDR